jgi:hypothetical protein
MQGDRKTGSSESEELSFDYITILFQGTGNSRPVPFQNFNF